MILERGVLPQQTFHLPTLSFELGADDLSHEDI
jgi:hypothetical protein